jgi:polyisoprenoid-binding protein YceI
MTQQKSQSGPNRLVWILVPVAFVAGIAVGVFGLLWATGGNATPSRDAGEVAATLSLDDETEDTGDTTTDPTAEADPTEDASEEMEPTAEEMEPTVEATAEEADAEADTQAASTGDTPERALFRITPEESEARFLMDETLMGNDIIVVGATDDIAGDIIVNFNDPAQSELGEIAVSARTLRTDQEQRDQAIRGRILMSSQDEFEFVTFTPTEFVSLNSDSVAVGDTLEFQITGDLTIRGTTNTVTFDTTVNVESEDRITGLATTEILYADYGITVQAPPTVSALGDVVTLELEFVATQVDES